MEEKWSNFFPRRFFYHTSIFQCFSLFFVPLCLHMTCESLPLIEVMSSRDAALRTHTSLFFELN